MKRNVQLNGDVLKGKDCIKKQLGRIDSVEESAHCYRYSEMSAYYYWAGEWLFARSACLHSIKTISVSALCKKGTDEINHTFQLSDNF